MPRAHPRNPFFSFTPCRRYICLHLPGDAFKGKTKAGPHGDFIFEMDHVVGELMKALKKHGMTENTLVIFSSDNGPEVPTSISMRHDHNHNGARPWRGVKRDQWEGGHRVPFIARWPGRIKTGSTSGQTICLTDLMATAAAITERQASKQRAAEDSYNILPALLGKDDKPIRKYTLHQTMSLALAIRKRTMEVPRPQGLWR